MARRRRKEPTKIGAYIITGMMVFLMVASILGVMLYAPKPLDETSFRNYKFSVDKSKGLYITNKEGETYEFNNLPPAVMGIKVDPEIEDLFLTSQMFIVTFNPEATEEDLKYIDFVRFELFRQMKAFGAGVTKKNNEYKLPIITCDNSTQTSPVIEINISDQPSIEINGTCIILSGKGVSLLQAKDALLYYYTGILTPEDALDSYKEEGDSVV